MYKTHICCLCLARDDLLRITTEKERLINLVLQEELPKNNRICINCSNTLSCFDKFQKTSRTAQKILKQQNITMQDQNTYLNMTSTAQDRVSDAFEIVLNWLSGVNVVLENHSFTRNSAVSNNSISVQANVDTLVINSVHGKEFVTENILPQYSRGQEAECDTILKTEYVDLIESSFDELEEPMEVTEGHTKMQEKSKIEKLMDEDEFLTKYRKNSKTGELRCYECPKCKKSFSRQELKYHFNEHKGLTPYKCVFDGCSFEFPSPYKASQHCKQSHKLTVSVTRWTGINKRGKYRRMSKYRRTSI